MIDSFRAGQQTFPPLSMSAKKSFPFRLACPSFVYPAGYSENVRHLAPFVDEIELLFFESRFPDSLPSRKLVRELDQLSASLDITYNVHLPTDIFLGHPDPGRCQTAVEVLKEMIERCALLSPTTYTLHLVKGPSDSDIRQWQIRTSGSLEAVLKSGIASRCISIENVDYDFELAAPMIRQLDLSVCMDMGHLMVQGVDPNVFYKKWRNRISMVHLHGVDGTRDHLPLDRLDPERVEQVTNLLRGYSNVVSLEVFSFEALDRSMQFLGKQWNER